MKTARNRQSRIEEANRSRLGRIARTILARHKIQTTPKFPLLVTLMWEAERSGVVAMDVSQVVLRAVDADPVDLVEALPDDAINPEMDPVEAGLSLLEEWIHALRAM